MFSKGFLGSVPVQLIKTIISSSGVSSWRGVNVACSGTFRTEGLLAKACPGVTIRSNDVSLFSVAMGRWLTGEGLAFRFVKDLAFIEDFGLEGSLPRLAAIVVAMNTAAYWTGSRNRYKDAHAAHFREKFLDYVTRQAAQMEPFKAQTPVSSFYAGDWLEHVEDAIERGFGVLAYPPTYKGGYEKMFSYLNENVQWDPPTYNIWDPGRIGDVVERLEASASPYFIYTDRKIEGRQHAIEFDQNGFHTVYGYARGKRTAFITRGAERAEQFGYAPLDPAKLTAASKVQVVLSTGPRLCFLKNCYLKRTIRHIAGRVNLLVYVDGMLAGGVVYRNMDGEFERNAGTFLQSDFSTTREGRIAKLVARVACCKEAIRFVERVCAIKIAYVQTTVFSDNPVSMKYRGVMDLKVRTEVNEPAGRYHLSYQTAVRDETAQDAYGWWAKNNLGSPERGSARGMGKARDGNPERRPEGPEAA